MTRISSSFKTDADGWTINGDVQDFEWKARGGNPGGYIYWEDAATGQDAYWQAPEKFLGDLSDYKRGALSFDWYSSDTNYDTADISITGANGKTIVADTADPTTDWTTVTQSLGADGNWHLGSLDGPLATKHQILAILHDVTQLQILAEHVNGPETGGLDNVELLQRPSPKHPDAAAFGDDRHAAHHPDFAAHQPLDPHVHLA